MTLLQAVFLGVIQGLTEFLPVSSTAHLLLVQELFRWKIPFEESFSFDVLVQLGTVLSLIVYFRNEWLILFKATLQSLRNGAPFSQPEARLGWLVMLATAPALVAGVWFRDGLEDLFKNASLAAAIRLAITALLLLLAERLGRRERNLNSLTWKDALWIGGAQVLSIFPGASRSGSTITGGMTRHLDRPAAARFAFLMSVPVMLAAGLFQSFQLTRISDLGAFAVPMLAGFFTAAVVGYLAVRWLLAFLARRPLYLFAIYCLALGSFSLIYSLVQ